MENLIEMLESDDNYELGLELLFSSNSCEEISNMIVDEFLRRANKTRGVQDSFNKMKIKLKGLNQRYVCELFQHFCVVERHFITIFSYGFGKISLLNEGSKRKTISSIKRELTNFLKKVKNERL